MIRLQRTIKELQARIQELEEASESERAARPKADRTKSDLHAELEELSQKLDEAGSATGNAVEVQFSVFE